MSRPAAGERRSEMDESGDTTRSQAASATPAPAGDGDMADLEARVIEAIRTVYDPEIPVNIYDMGLIYDIQISPDAVVSIAMTLTSPACPVAGWLPGEVEMRAREVEGVESACLELVWDPPWTVDMMSEGARLELGLM